MTSESTAECHGVPVEVLRQPPAELEVRLAGGSVSPDRGDLGYAPAGQGCLDRELEGEFETRRAFDPRRIEERSTVELEVVRRVVRRHAGEPVQRKAGGTAHQALQRRPADLAAAAHVARRCDDVGAVTRQRNHRVDDQWIVGTIGHRDEDQVAAGVVDPGPHGVEHPAPDVVAQSTQAGQFRRERLDDRARRIAVEVPDDDHLLRGRHGRVEGPQDGLDRRALVVDRDDDRQVDRWVGPATRDGAHRRPASSSARIHGTTSSSIAGRSVCASNPSTERALRTSGTRRWTSCSNGGSEMWRNGRSRP